MCLWLSRLPNAELQPLKATSARRRWRSRAEGSSVPAGRSEEMTGLCMLSLSFPLASYFTSPGINCGSRRKAEVSHQWDALAWKDTSGQSRGEVSPPDTHVGRCVEQAVSARSSLVASAGNMISILLANIFLAR